MGRMFRTGREACSHAPGYSGAARDPRKLQNAAYPIVVLMLGRLAADARAIPWVCGKKSRVPWKPLWQPEFVNLSCLAPGKGLFLLNLELKLKPETRLSVQPKWQPST